MEKKGNAYTITRDDEGPALLALASAVGIRSGPAGRVETEERMRSLIQGAGDSQIRALLDEWGTHVRMAMDSLGWRVANFVERAPGRQAEPPVADVERELLALVRNHFTVLALLGARGGEIEHRRHLSRFAQGVLAAQTFARDIPELASREPAPTATDILTGCWECMQPARDVFGIHERNRPDAVAPNTGRAVPPAPHEPDRFPERGSRRVRDLGYDRRTGLVTRIEDSYYR